MHVPVLLAVKRLWKGWKMSRKLHRGRLKRTCSSCTIVYLTQPKFHRQNNINWKLPYSILETVSHVKQSYKCVVCLRFRECEYCIHPHTELISWVLAVSMRGIENCPPKPYINVLESQCLVQCSLESYSMRTMCTPNRYLWRNAHNLWLQSLSSTVEYANNANIYLVPDVLNILQLYSLLFFIHNINV